MLFLYILLVLLGVWKLTWVGFLIASLLQAIVANIDWSQERDFMNKIMVLQISLCETCDYSMKLTDVATNKTLVEGDYYHVHVDDVIRGFIKGLEFLGVQIIMLEQTEYKCENCQ